MCTLIVSHRRSLEFPLILAANRDERLDRAALGWATRTTPAGAPMVAPLDVVAGGTWMGINGHHVVAALTNHHTGSPPNPRLRSRGELIGLSLDHATARHAFSAIPLLRADEFNPFHLVVADREFAFLWATDGQEVDLRVLEPGLHVVTESSALGVGPRGDFIRSSWSDTASVPQLQAILAHHADVPQHATCVHLGEIYGTRSSAILKLGSTSMLHTTDARPCVSTFTDRSALLAR